MSYSRNSSQDLIYNSYSSTYELASRLYTLTINTTPADATVTFQGGTVSGKTVSGLYNTIVSYSVSKEGYITRTGSFTLNHDETMSITLNEDDTLSRNGGGGGKSTYLKLNGNSSACLFAWSDNASIFYTSSRKPSIYEPLYNNAGERLTGYELSGKKGQDIIIKKISDQTTTECSYSPAHNIENISIANRIFYKNGGGGSGGRGEDWGVGATETQKKGGAGGGFYWLNTDTLVENSVSGRNAGADQDGSVPGMFPNVHSGKGGPYGIDSGATVVTQKTNYKQGGGASGANSAANSSALQSDSYFGSGGGGAGGDEDASGGKAGAGSSTYSTNTTGEDAYNYHLRPTLTKKKIIKSFSRQVPTDLTLLGRGGPAGALASGDTSGNHGWIYIYRFEKEYQTFFLGSVGGETPEEIIDARYISETPPDSTLDAGAISDTPPTQTIDGGEVFYEILWKDCGNISDASDETITLGGI